MQEPTTETGASHPEVKLSPADLARSWLGYRGADVQRQISSTEASLKFNSTYKPAHPGSRPHQEAGGMDHSDWEVSAGEYSQWPEEREELIEQGQTELQRLRDEATTISGQVSRVDRGETTLIDRYAKLETERRTKIEDAKKREDERKRGAEFNGVEELKGNLDEITLAVRAEPRESHSSQTPNWKDLSNGWELAGYYPREEQDAGGLKTVVPEQFQFYYTPDRGVLENRVFMRVYANNDGYQLGIEDFRNPEETDSMYGNGRKATKGIHLSLHIKEGRVFSPQVGEVVKETMWGYPETHTRASSKNERFDQNRFDEVKGLVSGLAASSQAVPQQ